MDTKLVYCLSCYVSSLETCNTGLKLLTIGQLKALGTKTQYYEIPKKSVFADHVTITYVCTYVCC